MSTFHTALAEEFDFNIMTNKGFFKKEHRSCKDIKPDSIACPSGLHRPTSTMRIEDRTCKILMMKLNCNNSRMKNNNASIFPRSNKICIQDRL